MSKFMHAQTRKPHEYEGYTIGPDGDRWQIQTYHRGTGEPCTYLPHVNTLAQARHLIDQWERDDHALAAHTKGV